MPNPVYELRTVDPVLTTLAQGYINSKYVANYLFPIVEVNKPKGRIPIFGKSSFLERTTERAMGSHSNRIPLTDFELIEFETQERDVEMAIDYLEEEQVNDFYKYEQYTTLQLSDILELNRELEAAKIATNPANYPTQNKIILDQSSAFNYGGMANDIIREAISRVRNSIGVRPNTMIISYSTYNALNQDISINDKLKYSGATTVNTKIIADFFEIRTVKVASSVFSPDGETFENIWGNNLIIAFVDESEPSNRSEFNPSFGYTLRRRGMPEIDTYYENGGKIKVIRNTDNYCIKITSPQAACLVANTII